MSAAFLDKARIKQAFSAASTTYDGVAKLQRTVGMDLLQDAGIERLTGSILDLGCGTGFLTAELLNSQPGVDTIFALDLAWTMLQATRDKLATADDAANPQKLVYLCADAEYLPLAEQSMHGVFSNLALQWCNRPEQVVTDIKRILKQGCPLVFSTFGPNTLRELRSAWAEVDDYSHVNEFYSEHQLFHFLEHAGFSNIRVSSTLYQSRYETVKALMQELKQIGAHNASSGRNKKLTTRTRMQGMISAYEIHREGNTIPASFDVINVVARA